MSEQPRLLPVGPQSTRVFCGSRLSTLNKEQFFKELGDTFMPGTPLMVAPLGLAAYVPIVIDPDPGLGLPDEAALIVYASNAVYSNARANSVSGRMYTHSHAGVFDLPRSRGQFPGPAMAPDKSVVDPATNEARWAWFLFEGAVDWQFGDSRILVLQCAVSGFQQILVDVTRAARPKLASAGVDQAIGVAGGGYGVVWLHSSRAIADVTARAVVPDGAQVMRDLAPTPVIEGPTITGPSAFTFRFARDLRFF